MKQLSIFLSLLLFINSAFAEFSTSKLETIRQKYNVPGAAAALISPSKVDVWATGIRKFGSDAAIETTDKFHLGSCTKAMTATLLAIIIERKQLTWDTTLAEIFPDLKMDEKFKSVTIGMLTAHRSGLTVQMHEIENGDFWQKLREIGDDVIEGRKFATEKMLTRPPSTEPGSTFEYSNWNYTIVGTILEKISQKSWEELIKTEIFEPLKMDSCGFGNAANPSLFDHPDQPWPHQMHNGQMYFFLPNADYENPATIAPAANVHCNLKDWSSFLKIHLDGFNGVNSPILKAKSFKKLHTAYPGQEYTYGAWMLLQRKWAKGPVLHHTGTNLLNYANVWLAPKRKQGYVSAINIGNGDEHFNVTDDIVSGVMKSAPANGQ